MNINQEMGMNVVDFAWQVIEMHRTILDQEREIERLTRIEENYNALLDSSLEHSKAIIGNVLKACEAAAKENK